MPEGPEVRIIVNQLNQLIQKQNLQAINIHSGRYSKKAPDGFLSFRDCLPLKLEEVKCRGKFIYFNFQEGHLMFNTLGMSGGWKVKKEKHSHYEFVFDDITLYFTDVRNFGTLKFVKGQMELQKKLKGLGTDVFTPEYNLDYVQKILGNSKLGQKTIVEVLMNQAKFCGIGNYLKSEILYACQISPHRKLEDLSETDIKNIHRHSKRIAIESYADGGGSAGEFSDLQNKKGSYVFKMMVYQQKKDPLGNKVIKETTKDKRTSHWVPEVQV